MATGNVAKQRRISGGYEVVSPSGKLEEENFDDYSIARYYPVRIGDVLSSRYEILGKLGFGSTSTDCLLNEPPRSRAYATLKVYTRDQDNNEELEMYQYLKTCSKSHPGYRHVRSALDAFTIPRAGGSHPCIVQKPLWESFRDLLARSPRRRFSGDLLKAGLHRTLLALDYLHTECHIIHTAVRGDMEHTEDVQPDVYRCSEVMLQVPWSYPIDIWNLGCVTWGLFEGKHLFYGQDPDDSNPNGTGYTTRAHLAEVLATLGLPPPDLLARGKRSREFFTEEGQWSSGLEIPEGLNLADSEENLEGEIKEQFLDFVRSMLCWRPEDRKTAKELLEHPWLGR
ncbi:hypothetical protein LTR62_006047 [Meristemomyces frigidus]|uniref:non-specific serine/threonine protein kinase n=1 Tax=Meristemomyces frigidus TaxID=1508187 RepID=A0AAN7YIV1_9PEZI|nr:hypothetical protein LTR62_006047 [Meristemomyces frigidus]